MAELPQYSMTQGSWKHLSLSGCFWDHFCDSKVLELHWTLSKSISCPVYCDTILLQSGD